VVGGAGHFGVPVSVGVPPVPGEIVGTPSAGTIRRRSEALAYPVDLFLAVYLVGFQMADSIF
jgi:hypothetical protein